MLAISAIALSIPMAAHAMHHGGGMYKELDLSESQRAEIKKIMQTQREETRQKIHNVLTPEQRAKAQTLHEQRMKKWKERKEHHRQGDAAPGDAS